MCRCLFSCIAAKPTITRIILPRASLSLLRCPHPPPPVPPSQPIKNYEKSRGASLPRPPTMRVA